MNPYSRMVVCTLNSKEREVISYVVVIKKERERKEGNPHTLQCDWMEKQFHMQTNTASWMQRKRRKIMPTNEPFPENPLLHHTLPQSLICNQTKFNFKTKGGATPTHLSISPNTTNKRRKTLLTSPTWFCNTPQTFSSQLPPSLFTAPLPFPPIFSSFSL